MTTDRPADDVREAMARCIYDVLPDATVEWEQSTADPPRRIPVFRDIPFDDAQAEGRNKELAFDRADAILALFQERGWKMVERPDGEGPYGKIGQGLFDEMPLYPGAPTDRRNGGEGA